MIWPDDRMADPPTWTVSDGYTLRTFREGDEDPYLALMLDAGFEYWTEDNVREVVARAGPDGVFFVEHPGSSRIVATAMGWYRPHENFRDASEMGWVAAAHDHRGRGLGRVVVSAATRTLLENGAKAIYLLTDDWRLPALKVYLEVGYVPYHGVVGSRQRWRVVCAELGVPEPRGVAHR